MLRMFFQEWRRWGFGTAIWNLRFTLGFRIGAFTSAKRKS